MVQFGAESNLECAPFLMSVQEGPDNCVSFIVSLGMKEKSVTRDADTLLNQILTSCVPIEPDENETYEIIFEGDVLHMVRNESFAFVDDYEIWQGDYYILFENSFLLEQAPKLFELNLAEAVCKNKCRHYGIICQNHIVDVISANAPIIRKCAEMK